MNYFLKIFHFSNNIKLILSILSDSLTLILSYILALTLRYDSLSILQNFNIYLILPIIIPTTILIFIRSNFYSTTIRFISFKTLKSSLIGIFVCTLLMLVISQSLKIPVPRSVPFIFMIIFFLSVNGKRFLLRYIYNKISKRKSKHVAIYGSNNIGLQLLEALNHNQNYKPFFFIDKNVHNSKKELGGLWILI